MRKFSFPGASNLGVGLRPLSDSETAEICTWAKEMLLKLEPASAEVFRQIAEVLKEASEPHHAVNNKMTPSKFALCTFPGTMAFFQNLIVNYDNIFPLVYDRSHVQKYHNSKAEFVGITLQ